MPFMSVTPPVAILRSVLAVLTAAVVTSFSLLLLSSDRVNSIVVPSVVLADDLESSCATVSVVSGLTKLNELSVSVLASIVSLNVKATEAVAALAFISKENSTSLGAVLSAT